MINKPRLAFTMGDPAGIGPEVSIKAAVDPVVLETCTPILVGSREVFLQASERFAVALPPLLDEAIAGPCHFVRGEATAQGGLAAYRSIMRSIDLALVGEVDGVVTAPISKAALHLAGIHESGHTEIFAKATGSQNYALMLTGPGISCVFVTCHQSLATVAASLTSERIVEVSLLADAALRSMFGRPPKLGLLALNPHAGEQGIFGREEIEILLPAVQTARSQGVDLSDPIPADTAFIPSAIGRYDGFVCMYHDQGGIPFKMLAFAEGVNVTLGLPLVRTSVDHGTAFDIAWQGKADPSSMVAAAKLAARLAAQRASEG